jgi:hypothetical protein
MRSVSLLRRLSAVGLAALLVACAGAKRSPAAAAAAAPAGAEAAESASTPQAIGALHPVAVERTDSTQRVRTSSAKRCGPRITRSLPPPSTFGRMAGWVGLGGPSEGEVPAPDFHTEVACTDAAVRRYEPAHYRVTYAVGAETYSVDVPERPGTTIAVDEADLPPPAPRQP